MPASSVGKPAGKVFGPAPGEPQMQRVARSRRNWHRPGPIGREEGFAQACYPQVRGPDTVPALGTARPKEKLPRSRTGSLTGPDAQQQHRSRRASSALPWQRFAGARKDVPGRQVAGSAGTEGNAAPEGPPAGSQGSPALSPPPHPPRLPLHAANETTRRPGTSVHGRRTRCDEHQDVRALAAHRLSGAGSRDDRPGFRPGTPGARARA